MNNAVKNIKKINTLEIEGIDIMAREELYEGCNSNCYHDCSIKQIEECRIYFDEDEKARNLVIKEAISSGIADVIIGNGYTIKGEPLFNAQSGTIVIKVVKD